MSKLLEMRERRMKLWESAKLFLDSKRQENGLVSDEDSAEYEKMEADIVALGREIEREERREAFDRELGAALNTPVTAGLPPSGAESLHTREFWNFMRGRQVTNSLNEYDTNNGVFLVPNEFERQLVQSLEENNIMRQLSRTITTASGTLSIPVVATKGTASWVDEEGAIPESDNQFAKVTLDAFKLATLIKVSVELMQDSAFPLDSYVAEDFGRRLGSKEEEAFLVGDGTKKPTGVLTSATVGKTAASATAVTVDDFMDLFYALKSPYRAKAAFVTNDQTVKALRKLKTSDGQYLWQPAVTAGTPDMILGRPIYTSAYMPTMAAGAKAVVFGDFSYYWIADRTGRTFQRLNELYAQTGQVGFIATQRLDAKLILPEAVQVLQMAAS